MIIRGRASCSLDLGHNSNTFFQFSLVAALGGSRVKCKRDPDFERLALLLLRLDLNQERAVVWCLVMSGIRQSVGNRVYLLAADK